MAKNLMIVESPSKAKTIQSYLGKDYKVVATIGHMIDLPTNKLGVDIDHKYAIDYTVIKDKDKIINDLKKEIKETTGTIFLSPDPDREGESIAWQVVKIFDLPESKYKRVIFHEVTKHAIEEAIQEPRKIDEHLVEAQQGRRILDRLVGYPLTQLIWKKVQYGLSAGRVQSAALRLIAEREEEIKNFIPEPYYVYQVAYKETGKNLIFRLAGSKGEIFHMSEDLFKKYSDLLKDDKVHQVYSYAEKDRFESPAAPFTTSMLQQTANKRFGFTAKMTMSIAQQLYQGVNIGEKGLQGLITYMRTDATYMSDTAINQIRNYITKEHGPEYLHETVRRYKTKAKVAQEAHEAIRPTHIEHTPEMMSKYLTPQQAKLYGMIWARAVGTQMKPAIIREKVLKTRPQSEKALAFFEKEKLFYEVKSEEVTFKGFYALTKVPTQKEQPSVPVLEKSKDLNVVEVTSEQLMTIPKSRYNDATLVKELEKKGIGRPSTYASIISTIVVRGYVIRDNKFLVPTDIGMLVAKFLIQYFPQIVDYNFTAQMEDKLDEIVNEHLKKETMLDEFYPKFAKEIAEKEKTIDKNKLNDLGVTDKECIKCGKKMHLKIGPYGKYYICLDENCGYKEPFVDETKFYIPEEVKKEGYILKKSRFGIFWAHPDYPNVKKTLPVLLKDICPECGKHLVERVAKKSGRRFVGCSGYPNCKYIANSRFKKYVKKSDKKGKTIPEKQIKTPKSKRKTSATKTKVQTKRKK